jgi:predicted RNA-binding Zn-ribbon protein involved in translation (DUF1610 family)
MTTFTATETYELHLFKCCSVRVGMPKGWNTARRADGNRFFCPNCGTGWSFDPGPTEADKLRTELANVKNSLSWTREERDRQAREAEYQKRRAAGARGLVTKLKNKAAKGECPCCGETFPDLHAHIQTAHPDFVKHKDDADVLEGESEREISLDKPLAEQVETKPLIHARPTGKHAQCPHCGKWLRNKQTLKAHIARMHP